MPEITITKLFAVDCILNVLSRFIPNIPATKPPNATVTAKIDNEVFAKSNSYYYSSNSISCSSNIVEIRYKWYNYCLNVSII